MFGETFTVTEDHIKLIQESYITFDDGMYYGSAGINIKRPYGNKDVLGDIAKAIGHPEYEAYESEDRDEFSEEAEAYFMKLHEEMKQVLSILAQHPTTGIQVGTYTSENFDVGPWTLQEEKHEQAG